MPQFPRFTSGSVGRLTFDVVNDLFARVESLEASRKENRTGTEQLGYPIMLAKVLEVRAAQDGSGCLEAKWVEQASSPCTGADMATGGRRSGTDADPWANAVYGNSLSVGQTVAIFANYSTTGGLVYRAIESSASSETFPALITGRSEWPAYTDGKVYRWKYIWVEATFSSPSPSGPNLEWMACAGGRNSGGFPSAFNTFERDGIIGIGGGVPASARLSPAPVSIGTVVMLSRIPCQSGGGGFWAFSAGPVVSVSCAI